MPTLLYLAPALLVAASCLGVGALLPGAWLPEAPLLRGLSRFAAGSVALSVLLLALGRVGAFHPVVLQVVTGVFGATGLACIARTAVRRRLWRLRARPSAVAGALLTVTAVALALDLLAASAPPSSADALKYHLALPRLWLQDGSIGDPFWRWEGFSPSALEMHFAQGLALGAGEIASAVAAIFTVLAVVAVFGLARELAGGSLLAGAAGAALFALQGIVTWEASSAFVEPALTFFVVLAAWYAVRWLKAPSRLDAGWCGIACGGAAGTKYLGLMAAAIVLVPLAVAASRRRRFGDAGLAGVLAFCCGGAWYVKNAVVTGNPVYPFFFGGKWWTATSQPVLDDLRDRYGVGHSPLRLILLPLELLLHGNAFDRGQYVGTGIFLLALAALVVPRSRAVLVCVAGAVVYTAAWFYFAPQARFLFPALAVLAAAGGAVVPRLAAQGSKSRVALLALAVAIVGVWLVSSVALTRQLVPVAVGAEGRASAAQRLTGTYEALRAVRRDEPGTVAFAGYDLTFYYPGRAVQLGAPAFAPDVPRDVFLSRLGALDVRAVVVVRGNEGSVSAIRACLVKEKAYPARYVTSRSLGRSMPLVLDLYALRCP